MSACGHDDQLRACASAAQWLGAGQAEVSGAAAELQKGQLRAEAERQRRHAPRAAVYAAVHTLHAQGIPVAVIARTLGISCPTVYTYLRRDTPPGPKQPQFQR